VRLGWQHTAGAAAHVELGYASGDNDPRDATAHTFTMHSDHNVGIVLFEQVLPLLTARSVDRASDPSLVGVPMAGIRFAVNPGAVQNAAYGNAVVRFRPRSALDVRLGYLFAVPVADVIDVYQTALQGGFPAGFGGRLYDRGSYGHEVDAQTTYELVLDRGLRARLGVEAGVLLPGTAFDGVARIRPAGGDPRALWIGRALASLVW
jgi:hypothetical protein